VFLIALKDLVQIARAVNDALNAHSTLAAYDVEYHI
jgi:hypothetical protein